MAANLHIPILRGGKVYESLDTVELAHPTTGESLARISQANPGIIRKDLSRIEASCEALQKLTIQHLLDICAQAGELFMTAALPIGDGGDTQSPEQFVEQLSTTSGLPHALCRRNMAKIHQVFTQMPGILRGLTRGLDLSILDEGVGRQSGMLMSYYPSARSIGVVLPSNSPGVNSLWMPAIALKVPVVLKPGREEPWTPSRIIQAFIAAGCPPEAFFFYPTDHEGAATILKSCDRALLFGDERTTAPYANNPAIQIHGPGWSKVLIGEDKIDHWRDYIDVMVDSIAANGGRSCINASAIVVPRHADEIADALAQRLAVIQPTSTSDEGARLSAFANPAFAEYIDGAITEGLQTTGADEVTAQYRTGDRKVTHQGRIYLQPTLIRCRSLDHPLANREFLFPYASVLQIPQVDMLDKIGSSLVVTAITEDEAFIKQLVRSPLIDRLNIGALPTSHVEWDQPHEGNLFEFLYKRRAIQRGTA